MIFIERVRIIEFAEVVVDASLLDVSAGLSPFDVRVLQAVCARTVGAERLALRKGTLESREDRGIQNKALKVQLLTIMKDFDP